MIESSVNFFLSVFLNFISSECLKKPILAQGKNNYLQNTKEGLVSVNWEKNLSDNVADTV